MGNPRDTFTYVRNTPIRPLVLGVALTILTTGILLPEPPIPPISDFAGWGDILMGVVQMGSLRVTDSLEILHEERNRTIDERAAFKQFATRVNNLPTDSPQLEVTATATPTLTISGKAPSGNTASNAVCQIYRETVMDTNHYQEEYGDTLPESVSVEFGTELATALLNGDSLSESLQEALVAASLGAANQRKQFERTLTTEITALTHAQDTLRDLTTSIEQINEELSEPSFETLVESHKDLQQLEAQADALIKKRQTQVAELPQPGGMPLLEYLHRDQDWTYPVLADTLDAISEIETRNSQITHQLAQQNYSANYPQ